MNRMSIVFGAVAAFSFTVAALLFHSYNRVLVLPFFGISRRYDADRDPDDRSSLEQDFQDILEIMPTAEIRRVVEKHAKHDKQIDDTIAFVNDQYRFILAELHKIPYVRLYIFILRHLKLDVDLRVREFAQFWRSLPAYEGCKHDLETGGLTGMISHILRLIPRDQLHALLCNKMKTSASFRTFVFTLKSQQFGYLCEALQTNVVLQRHFHWAKESGIEAIFALELLGDFYAYMIREIE